MYFGSLGATLYFSLGVSLLHSNLFVLILHQLQSFLGSLICGIVQVVALVVYVAAYFPGGTQTIRLGGQLAMRGAGSLLPR